MTKFTDLLLWRTRGRDTDDAFLVRDRDGNGKIDSGRELYGDNTLLTNGRKAANGYQALVEEDSNGDGVIDANWNALRLWQDKNQDGTAQAEELSALSAYIESTVQNCRSTGGDGLVAVQENDNDFERRREA